MDDKYTRLYTRVGEVWRRANPQHDLPRPLAHLLTMVYYEDGEFSPYGQLDETLGIVSLPSPGEIRDIIDTEQPALGQYFTILAQGEHPELILLEGEFQLREKGCFGVIYLMRQLGYPLAVLRRLTNGFVFLAYGGLLALAPLLDRSDCNIALRGVATHAPHHQLLTALGHHLDGEDPRDYHFLYIPFQDGNLTVRYIEELTVAVKELSPPREVRNELCRLIYLRTDQENSYVPAIMDFLEAIDVDEAIMEKHRQERIDIEMAAIKNDMEVDEIMRQHQEDMELHHDLLEELMEMSQEVDPVEAMARGREVMARYDRLLQT